MIDCRFCRGALNLFKEAVDTGLRFSPGEVRVMVAKAERDIRENTEILASRGYVEINGRWQWLDSDQVH